MHVDNTVAGDIIVDQIHTFMGEVKFGNITVLTSEPGFNTE